MKIEVKEVPIEEAVKVNATIIEFKDEGAPYQKEYFEERYKGNDHLIIVAYVDGKPAGYVVAYDRFNDGSLYSWMVGVDPKFRGKGVFKAMMDYQNNWAKNKGYNKIRIKTRNNRREMLAYLVKYGFDVVDFEQKPDVKENRILFERKL